MTVISGVKKREDNPAQHEPLEEGAMAVSFSNKKDAEAVKERATERKATAKKPATKTAE